MFAPLKMNTRQWLNKVLVEVSLFSDINPLTETGGLFQLAVDLMQLFSENKRYYILY